MKKTLSVLHEVQELLLVFAGWLAIYFAPVFPMIGAIGFFVMIDLWTGIKASVKNGDKFCSKRLRDTVDKFISYGLAILVSFLVEKYFLSDFPALKVISGGIAYIELKSINENLYITTGHNFFQVILDRFKRKNEKSG